MDTPFGWGHLPDKWAVIPASPLDWADGGPICEVSPFCAAFIDRRRYAVQPKLSPLSSYSCYLPAA